MRDPSIRSPRSLQPWRPSFRLNGFAALWATADQPRIAAEAGEGEDGSTRIGAHPRCCVALVASGVDPATRRRTPPLRMPHRLRIYARLRVSSFDRCCGAGRPRQLSRSGRKNADHPVRTGLGGGAVVQNSIDSDQSVCQVGANSPRDLGP